MHCSHPFFFSVGEVTYVELHTTPDGKAMGTGYVYSPYLTANVVTSQEITFQIKIFMSNHLAFIRFYDFVGRIIEFKDEDTAKKAIEKMHKYDLKTRKIIVREVSL